MGCFPSELRDGQSIDAAVIRMGADELHESKSRHKGRPHPDLALLNPGTVPIRPP
jgi:hypothetical protein